MDTNNRRITSTQHGALDQNTAFGTQKKPEGFASTWKNATHLWRWRAILCLFLSLLLVMMQPAGNSLYRSWTADGTMMGLAAAFEGDSEAGADNTADNTAGEVAEGLDAQGGSTSGLMAASTELTAVRVTLRATCPPKR